MMKHIIQTAFALLLFIPFSSSSAAESLGKQLEGRILLQVEQNGEAWYVRTDSNQRMFLGRAEDAFRVMLAIGDGIEDDNLARIEIDTESLFSLGKEGLDEDNDGLTDDFEVFFSTDINNADSDGDGFNDYVEVSNGYNPNGPGKVVFDTKFAQSLAGRILLQVEQNGEAWYVDPVTLKRHFLGHPHDAFKLMRKLGLGISDTDLSQIQVSAPSLLDEKDISASITGKINLPKSIYAVGEPFLGGDVELTYNGAPFTAFVVQGIRKNTEKTIYKNGIRGLFEEIDFVNGKKKNFSALQPLSAFNFEQGGFLLRDDFKEAGQYHYVLQVYNCSDIQALHNITCEELSLNNLDPFDPVFSVERTVIVTN